MGGSSSVAISNWDGMFSPLETMYNTAQTNHGEWYGTYVEEAQKWRDFQAERQNEWLEINYGYPDNLYDKNVDGSGGVYGDARRSESFWRKVQLAIAGLQQAASFYFADKQYQAAKEAREHQMEVWETEKKWAQRYQDTWYEKYLPLELKLLNKIKAKLNDPNATKPRYDIVESRAVGVVRSEFARAGEKVRRCIDPRCVGALCDTLKQLAFEEAKSAAGAIDKAYRAEEARADNKEAQYEESAFNMAKLGRGLASASLGALNSAAQAAQIAATYNPYEGYEQAAGGTFGYWHSFASDRSIQQGSTANIIGRQASGYMMTQGQLSSPSDMLMPATTPPPVTGTTGSSGMNYFDNSVNGGVLYDNTNIIPRSNNVWQA